MYAHQAIEDLSDWEFNNISDVLTNIKEAHKFNFGDCLDYNQIVKGKQRAEEFLKEFGEFIRLPYKKCWFDWTWGPSLKGAVCVQEVPDTDGYTLVVNPYMINSLGQWAPILVSYGIHPQNYILKWFTCEVDTGIISTSLDLGNQILVTAMKCLLLLNCSNIETTKIDPSLKLNKKRARKGRLPIFSYHTLRIKASTHAHRDSHCTATDFHNRIHLCRGHFKRYTGDAPLFGRITGLWWWQPHVRGQNRDGIVMKDYKVQAGVTL